MIPARHSEGCLHRRSSHIAVLALFACTAPEEVADVEDTTVDGIIFKGPLVAGSSVTIQPVDGALQPVGDAVSAEVDLDSGRYEATVLQHQGLVRISVEGALYDEAARGRVDVPTELSAYAVLGGATEALHLNVLGDLSRSRVENLVAQGSSAADAISQAQEELVSALDLGGVTPQRSGAALDVYTDSTDARGCSPRVRSCPRRVPSEATEMPSCRTCATTWPTTAASSMG